MINNYLENFSNTIEEKAINIMNFKGGLLSLIGPEEREELSTSENKSY